MRNRVPASRSRILGQVAVVAIFAAAVAGCNGSSRLSKPLFTGSTENQRQIIGDDHHEMFSQDQMPAVNVYWGESYVNSPVDLQRVPPFRRSPPKP